VRKTILLVDDTVTVTALEKIILGPGYDYVEARNGAEAFEAARAGRPHLILMDLNMPVKDGLEGLRSLKGDATTAGIPVVIVSTKTEGESAEQCRALGCAGFVRKPIDRQLLVDTVRRLLG
jgi:CheY-like chemotaxis protein